VLINNYSQKWKRCMQITSNVRKFLALLLISVCCHKYTCSVKKQCFGCHNRRDIQSVKDGWQQHLYQLRLLKMLLFYNFQWVLRRQWKTAVLQFRKIDEDERSKCNKKKFFSNQLNSFQRYIATLRVRMQPTQSNFFSVHKLNLWNENIIKVMPSCGVWRKNWLEYVKRTLDRFGPKSPFLSRLKPG